MDATSPPRKRGGRPSKAAPQQSNTDAASTSSHESDIQPAAVVAEVSNATPQSLDASVDQETPELHTSVLALSPEPEEPTYSGNSSLTGAGGECRRSSRKKVIKFDVRDLLNKNRKPHKIQIEARIDSNAPTAHLPKATIDAAGCSAASSTSANNAATADLTSKQKTFIEKSAIFRRFSISAEQQNKAVQPLRPPPVPNKTTKISLLGKSTAASSDVDAVLPAVNVAKIAQTSRLSRTQEIFNSMMKSKQNSSLIIAQMQSNSSATNSSNAATATSNLTPPAHRKSTGGVGKRKGVAKAAANTPSNPTVNPSTPSESTELKDGAAVIEVSTQKRRGRPPKSKVTEKSLTIAKDVVDADLGSCETKSETETSDKLKEVAVLNLETVGDNVIEVVESSSQPKLTPEKAKNWKEYKSCLNESDNSKAPNSSISAVDTKPTSSIQSLQSKAKNTTENQSQLELRQHQIEDIILEISSSSASSSVASLKSKTSAVFSLDKSKVNLVKSASLTDKSETKQRNFAVVSFLQESPDLNDDNITAPEFIVASVEEIIPEIPDTKHCKASSAEVVTQVEKLEEVERDSSNNEKTEETLLKSPLTRIKPAQEVSRLSSPTRRTISSSESETNSDRSNKPYKQGDKLRVSLKRVTMPESPTASNSFTTSSSRSSSEISTESTSSKSRAESLAPKVPSAKRSKRLQKKKKVAEQDEADSTNSEESKELTVFEEYMDNEVEMLKAEKPDKISETRERSKLKQVTVTSNAVKISESVENKNDTEQRTKIVKETLENVVKPTNLKVTDSSVNQPQVSSPTILSDSETGEKRKSLRLAKTVENVEDLPKIPDEKKEIFKQIEIITPAQLPKIKDEEKEEILKHIEIIKPAQEPAKISTKTSDNTNQDDSTRKISDIVKADEDVISEQIELTSKTLVQNIEITETIEDVTKKDVEEETTPESAELSTSIQNVSVETSTLLDILRTVQSNKKAATNVLAGTESPPTCDEIVSSVGKNSLIPPVSEIPSTVTNKLQDTRATDSPTRSETDSPQTLRKATRRYERRSRRGEDTPHNKTLEETFAEIAAQSSKAILELAAREEEEIFAVSNLDSKAIICDESRDAPIESKDNAEGLDNTTIVKSLVEVPGTSKTNIVEVLPKQSETTMEHDESIQMNLCEPFVDVTETERNSMLKCDDVFKDNSILETEAKIELPKSTDSRPTEPDAITTPTRRGRRPKSKPKSPITTKELSINLTPVTEPKTNIEEMKSSTLLKDDLESIKSVENLDENSESCSEKTNLASNPTSEISQLVLDIPTPSKEDHTQIKLPTKITCENVEADEKHLLSEASIDSLVETSCDSNTSKQVPLETSINVCEKDGTDLCNINKDIQVTGSSEDSKDQFAEHVTHIEEGGQSRLSLESTSSIPTPKRGKIKQKSHDLISDGEESRSSVSSITPIPTLKRGKNKEKMSDAMRSDEVKDVKYIEEESLSSVRSPTPTSITLKRTKSKPKLKEVVTEQASTSKKKSIKLSEEPKTKIEKPTTKSADKKEKEKPLSKKLDKKKFLELEDIAAVVELTTKFEEKTAKKKRQKKLKEAFEAALSDNLEKTKNTSESKDSVTTEMFDQSSNTPERESPTHTLPMTPTEFNAKPDVVDPVQIQLDKSVVSIAEPEEDPDPLKDIEKFIEDGVNLLKRDYKIDDDSVDEAIMKPTVPTVEDTREDSLKCAPEQIADNFNTTTTSPTEMISEETSFSTASTSECSKTPENTYFETPADTPLATPTASPPPKSPINEATPDEISGVRRSHRIKQITKTPKALVGRGLVRDKERFSFKDDVETKSHYSLDDHLTDLAEVEAKNAKFLKDMEERLSNFQVIKENEYKCERVISREARKMICDCFLTSEEEGRGELGCGEDCLNRLLMIECGPDCNVKDRCTNKRFQIFLCSPCRVFRTEKKGFGIMADIEILPGEFIMEYVGEVINGDEFENRRTLYSQDKNRHYYFMALRSDAIIDATIKGNISRFINHSCDPNAETQKWTVNGELRIGFFSRKSIMPGEEITFDYQYQRYGREAQRCYCESSNCRGWIGEEPNSDEGEQVDADSDEEEEETEMLAESLLDDDDDDDSDTESVTDAEEEVQKKLEIAAAEAKLTPISDEQKDLVAADDTAAVRDKKKKSSEDPDKVGEEQDERKETEEDSKSKFKKLLSKMAEKVAKKKQKQNENKKRKRRPRSPGQETATAKPRYLEDPDIEDEVNFLSSCGLKNQSDTLRLSRLMVRAKLVQTRLNLLQILRKGELPCRRLFLDYHGMRFLHGWMTEDGGDMNIRMALLETLESLPIANKTVLTDSKVYQAVRNWCGTATTASSSAPSGTLLSPSDDSSKESSTSSCNPQQTSAATATAEEGDEPSELQKLAAKLTATWDSLPEIFRIPKRERIEQMKEHEREADRQYAAAVEDDTNRSSPASGSVRYQRDRFGRSLNLSRFVKPHSGSKEVRNITVMGSGLASGDPRRRLGLDSGSGHTSAGDSNKLLSKEQRREMFAAKVARDEAEKRLAEERREFETKCRFFGLDPKKTRPTDVPFCVNPATGQWFSAERKPIQTPPSYAHVQVPTKPQSTDPADYQLPAVVATLAPQWKYAITPQGKIYYYHVQFRIPQWEPPTYTQMYGSSTQGQDQDQTAAAADSDSESEGGADDSTDDDDEILIGMNQTQLKAYIEKKIELRRQQRYNRLVDERCISPRREEDRVYNQIEVRKYKENKEKIRKRKEEIRRKRAEAIKHTMLNMCTLGSLDDSTTASGDPQAHRAATSSTASNTDEPTNALPIQDYLLSSDDDCGEEDIKTECNNSPLLDKIVQGDKIVDELDALTKRTLKRAPPQSATSTSSSTSLYRDLGVMQASTSAAAAISASTLEKNEHKRRKLEKKEKSKKSKDSADSKYRKTKEKFRCEIAGIIVHHLKPYRKDSCFMGRIQSDEDFNHLARKLTHFVMIKELKYCESVGQTLVVTESVKNKSREFIKKYMAKYGDVYVKSTNDPEFKDIPFSL